MNIRHTVAAFFGRHNFDAEGPAVNTIIDTLLYDMEEGLKRNPRVPVGTGPALDMIPTWLMPPQQPPKNTSVIVIDAGGTNFRSCLVTFDENSAPSISRLERKPMPATDREYSKAEFFETIASYLDHLKDAADSIAFCFSYAMKITPAGDGEVLQFSKEIKAPEVIGSLVGQNLEEALMRRGWNKLKRIVLLNDTVAALLAGASTAVGGKKYDSYVGFILGTGMNAAYIEYQNIPKIASNSAGTVILPAQIVVCESGKSNKQPRSDFDEAFTKKTGQPQMYWFEKMCSGAYLGSLASVVIRAAAADNLLSAGVKKAFASIADLPLMEVNSFLQAPYSEQTALGLLLTGGTEEDREILYRLLDALIMRTARLAAGNIAAAVIKTGKGKNPARPVCILVEGTTFLKTYRLHDAVTAHLHTALTQERGIYFDEVFLDHAITFGTAIAGTI